MKYPRHTIVGTALASFLLLVLAVCTGLSFFCSAAWCPNFAWSKIRSAADFTSCQQLGFPVEQTYPQRCIAGAHIYYASDAGRLRIVEPRAHQKVSLPLIVSGDVRIGSGMTARLALIDRDGFALAEEFIQLPRALSGQIVPFRTLVSFSRPFGTGGVLSISLLSRKGNEIEQAKIPVQFHLTASIEIKAFFSNNERDPKTEYCDVSYPVARRVAVSEDLLSASLRELLKGPSILEQSQNFSTNLPEGLEVESIRDEDGDVTVTFNKALVQGVAGSCRVQAIRSQIERTLRQFPFVKGVTIAVEGVPDAEVLQP